MARQKSFSSIGYEDFRALAQDGSLSKYERIGFPDSYRKGFEQLIFADILSKLDNLEKREQKVLDIGPGCSDLPLMLIEKCREQGHFLALIDSKEMLDLLPQADFVQKEAALYPRCPDFLSTNAGKLDVILCYSVLHYVLVDTAFFRFWMHPSRSLRQADNS